LEAATAAQIILAPDIIRLEVASAISRAHRRNEITAAAAEQKLREWIEFTHLSNFQVVPSPELLPTAFALSLELRHALPDCLYLALTANRQVPFITSDRPLCEVAHTQPLDVRHIAKWSHTPTRQ
jgi:predicted nucleic acid-binding protein